MTAPACAMIGSSTDILEALLAIAAPVPNDLADVAIAALDQVEGDADLECDEAEPEDGEETDLPALMDGFGGTLGLLPVYESCGCCGHTEFAGYLGGAAADQTRVAA